MTIGFFINDAAKAKKSTTAFAVYLKFTFRGQNFRFNSGIKMRYSHFSGGNDPEKLVLPAYGRETGQDTREITAKFRAIHSNIIRVAELYDGGHIHDSDLKEIFRHAIAGKLQAKKDFMDYYRQYIDFGKAKGYTDKTIKTIENARSVAVELFATHRKVSKDVFNVNADFFTAFRDICTKRGYRISTYNKYLKWTKAMLAYVQSIHPEASFNEYYLKESEQKEIPNSPLIIFDHEIRQFWEHEFSYAPYRQHRDMFIFQLLSGQRHCEMETLARSLDSIDPESGIWYAFSSKTKKTIRVPMTKVMMEIYERYKKDGKFMVRSNQKRNEMLKKIAEMAGLDRTVTRATTTFGKGKPVFEQVPLYSVISTHVARASMITILSQDQGNNVVRQLSGHASEKDLKRYQGEDMKRLQKVMDNESTTIFKQV